jgi:hypothetical protein
VAPDPLDEWEATLEEARRRAEEPKSNSAELQAEGQRLRRLMDELADAIQDAAHKAKYRQE